MKIIISSEGTNLKAKVGHRFGVSPYLIIADLSTGNFQAVPNPGALAQRGAGVHTIVLAIREGVKAVLTGYCAPAARHHLEANGIEVFIGIRGTVGEFIEKYKKGDLQKNTGVEVRLSSKWGNIDRIAFFHTMRSSLNQFTTLLPVFLGVVMLIGLLNTLVSNDFLTSIFSGNVALDTILGACFGSILAGNPINSYVIGGEMLRYGISLFAVTAFIITWVTVGLIQLPAEIAALGTRFALLRNTMCFILSVPVAILTVLIFHLVTN